MADQPKTIKQTERAPNTNQTAIFLTAATVGGTLLVLSGLTLTATAISLLMATPLLVIWSPILMPTTFLVATGFIFSSGFGIAALSVVAWMYRYATGKHPPGSEQLDHVMKVLVHEAKIMKNKAKEYAYQVRDMAQQITKRVQNMGNSEILFSENRLKVF